MFCKGMCGTNKFVSTLKRMSMKYHSKLGGFLRIKAKIFERLHHDAVGVVNGSTHSQKDGEEASLGCSSLKMLMKHAVLLVHGFELAPRTGIFAIFCNNKMDVLIVCELTGRSSGASKQRLINW